MRHYTRCVEVNRIDAAPAEGLDEGNPIIVAVIADHVEVGGDQGAKILEERDVHWGHVIEGTDAYGEHMIG